ncbi:20S rRNA accumulation protein 4 [Yarrowia sp. C11]|nr:20S rRNA accumulation protein 4 [Yarrowia sp. C11]
MDSDSDFEFDSDYETSTYLGFVDEPDSAEIPASPLDTRLGGQPIWLHPESPAPQELMKCLHCHKQMPMLLQAYSTLEDKYYDRVMYVFSCPEPGCRRQPGSVRALRSIRRDPEREVREKKRDAELKKIEEQQQKEKDEARARKREAMSNIGSNLVGEKSGNPFASGNPFSAKSDNPFAKSENPFAKKAEEKAVEAAEEVKTVSEEAEESEDAQSPSSPTDELISSLQKTQLAEFDYKRDVSCPKFQHGYYLYTEQEYLTPESQRALPEGIKIDMEAEDGETTDETAEGVVDKEYEKLVNVDKLFHRFSDIVEHNPEQVVRYEFKGQPLYYADDEVSKEVGELIKSDKKAFEFQVMPNAISQVSDDIINGMEWGTIMVCVDPEDNLPELDKNNVGYAEEFVGVQWEKEHKE